jgi:hypothetical protein
MWEFSVFRALGLLLRTLPFVLYRAAVYLGLAAVLVAAAGVGAGVGHVAAGASDQVAPGSFTTWGGLAGLVLGAGGILFLRGQLLYRVKAAHLALMVEALDQRPPPLVRGQFAWARSLVDERFGDASALVSLDRLVRSVIRTATGLVDDLLADILPLPGLDRLARSLGLHLLLARGLIEGVVLGHALRTRSENAWEAAHDGLVLYTQNARPMMLTAVWLSLIGWLLAALAFLALLPSATAAAALLPAVTGAGPLLAAACAWAVKAALLDPFAQACLLQLHLRLTEGQDPLPEWRGRLTQVSDKFRLLGEQALGWRAQDA